MFGVIQSIFRALALVAAVIAVVERPGEGEQKKQEVMQIIRERLPVIVTLPKWVQDLFLESAFLSWIIDLIVWVANRYGFFTSSSSGETASTTA